MDKAIVTPVSNMTPFYPQTDLLAIKTVDILCLKLVAELLQNIQ
jgi:hypothetical protein